MPTQMNESESSESLETLGGGGATLENWGRHFKKIDFAPPPRKIFQERHWKGVDKDNGKMLIPLFFY